MNSEKKQKEGIFDDKHAPMLDADWRLKELQPEKLVKELAGIKANDTCVDLGSGTGIFALPMAVAAGKSGQVYAVDNSDRMLGIIRAKKAPAQLIPVKADVTETGLESNIADVCLLAFILHEVEDKDKLMAETHRLLKPGGRAIVIEWRYEADMPIPPKHKRIPKDKIEEIFRRAGLTPKEYVERTERHYAATGEKDG